MPRVYVAIGSNLEPERHVRAAVQALRARFMMHRDKDYVVKNGEIVIVDEFTGRLMFGRRYSDMPWCGTTGG